MGEPSIKTRKLSFSSWILIGMAAGVVCGIVFGEYCAFLEIFGNGFIKLLQITILPYILVSLIQGIGGLTYSQARQLAIRAGALLLVFWGIIFAIILLMPLSFPKWVSAAFFSSALVETPPQVDFLNLYIPSNPFASLANNLVPAVVLFSILIGVALIGIEKKETLLKGFGTTADALIRVTNMIVKLTPFGVFAIAAAAAGTMTIEDFGRLQVYLVSFNVAVLLLTFWVLPMMLTPMTPFKYKDIVGLSRDALVTAFTTGNLFVVLTVLTENCKAVFEKYNLRREKTDSYIDVIIPVSFNFPNMGKLIMLLFVLFAVWFMGIKFTATQYGTFVFSGLLSFFGGVDVALPFMLDLLQLPSDMYQLYVVTGIINGRSATLLAAMNLIVFTMLATASLTGVMKINKRKLLQYIAFSLLITAAVVGGTRMYLSLAVSNRYERDKLIANLQLLVHTAPKVVYREPPASPVDMREDESVLARVRRTGVLRVGYHPDNMPFSYFNQNDQLVGFDVDMALLLASELGCKVEFYPFEFKTLADQLDQHHFDVAMSGVSMSTERLSRMRFTDSYIEATLAFVVPDYDRQHFSDLQTLRQQPELTLGIPRVMGHLQYKVAGALPRSKIVIIDSPRDYFSNLIADLDGIIMSAEAGSAWTLIYPDFDVVVPKPDPPGVPLAYPVVNQDGELAQFLSRWIALKRSRQEYRRLYDHWILGLDAEERKPRWSVIRNVLHWVD